MMYYYVVNDYKEVGFFKSDVDMSGGGSVFAELQDFTIVGYSVDEIKINGFVIDLGTIDVSSFFSAQKLAEDGWRIVSPIEVHGEEDVKELYRKFQYKPLAEYVGGVEPDITYIRGLSMVPDVDEDDLPF